MKLEISNKIHPSLIKKKVDFSKEYEFGTLIFEKLTAGQCAIIPSDMSVQKVKMRLNRINSGLDPEYQKYFKSLTTNDITEMYCLKVGGKSSVLTTNQSEEIGETKF